MSRRATTRKPIDEQCLNRVDREALDAAIGKRLAVPVSEFASMFSISVAHAYALVARGELNSVRLGGAVKIPRSEVARMLAEAQ